MKISKIRLLAQSNPKHPADEHFKNYLISGDKTEDQLSNDKLSLAFKQELVYADFLSKNH